MPSLKMIDENNTDKGRSPVLSPFTAHLKEACRNKSSQVQEIFIGSQSQRVFLLCHALNIISFKSLLLI